MRKYPTIKLRRDTEANFISENTILASGEPAFAIDSKVFKIGDGTSTWVQLTGITGGGSGGGPEINNLAASVIWANVPDANITQSSVVQHSGALRLTESQITDLQNYITSGADISSLNNDTNYISSNPNNIAGSSGINNIVQISQIAYNQLVSHDPNTLYLIKES